jgi:hypothetical protein
VVGEAAAALGRGLMRRFGRKGADAVAQTLAEDMPAVGAGASRVAPAALLAARSSVVDATVTFAKGGRGSNRLIDELTEIIRDETSKAYTTVATGGGAGRWARHYRRVAGSATFPEYLKKIWHGNAVQEVANRGIAQRLAAEPHLAALTARAFKMNRGGYWGRLRPDFQLRLPSGQLAVWDISTEWGLPKIWKYNLPSVLSCPRVRRHLRHRFRRPHFRESPDFGSVTHSGDRGSGSESSSDWSISRASRWRRTGAAHFGCGQRLGAASNCRLGERAVEDHGGNQ